MAPRTSPKAKQKGFEDKKIPDKDTRIQVAACIETMHENGEAYSEYTKAKRDLRALIDPFVQAADVGDRLEICDGEIREITITEREPYTVEASSKKRAIVPMDGDGGE